MSRVVEIRAYNLKPGTREDFARLFEEQARPMLARWGVDLIGFGPSLHDENAYYLMRCYSSTEERQRSQDVFYGSDEWRQGPREAIIACIESMTSVVVPLDESTIAGLRRIHIEGRGSMTDRASGTFEVKLTPQGDEAKTQSPNLGRSAIDKQFHGDLEGLSEGQMLSAGTEVKGSAGYVAIERVTGTLHGREGSFVLMHRGVMTRGAPELAISVVPDSGTGALVGLAGTMAIQITDGKHSYDFEYTLVRLP